MYRIAVFLSLATVVFADGPVNIRGELISPTGEFPMAGYSVELTNPANRSADFRAVVNASGVFELHSIPPGAYRVRILKDEQQIHQAYVTANTHSSLIQIDLPQSKTAARPSSGTVSLHRLSHKPPKKAVKEMNRAAKARRKGDIQKSLEHLEKAVEIDPQYVEAHVNLGARYVEVQRMDDAEAAFTRAIRIDPHCAAAHSNLGLVMIHKQKPREAEAAARRAIGIDDSNPRAHYVLAFSLAMQDPSSEEALTHFIRASEAYPLARVGAAQILIERGDGGRAETQLAAYLESGDQARREAVQGFLAKLKQ